jgi:hypothetical protein
MRPESADDRLAYLEAFGVPASCDLGKCTVVFDEPVEDAVFDDNSMGTTAPQCSGPTEVFRSLGLLERSKRLTIETDDGPQQFVVRDPRPDGSGWTTLVLDAP